MRYFFRRRIPRIERLLLVESGQRAILDRLLPLLQQHHPGAVIDLVTCYGGAPEGFDSSRGRVYRIPEYRGRPGALTTELAARGYSAMGIICSDEPIMTKWKWLIALRLHSKLFLINENSDFFWFDWGQARTIREFVLFRAGLYGPGAVRTLGRLLLFPATLVYLILYAAQLHARRALRRT